MLEESGIRASAPFIPAVRNSLSFVMFRTELSIDPSQHKIALEHRILTIGSCFAEAIGRRLHDDKFRVLTNPFGTTYNPVSIHSLLTTAIRDVSLPENTYLQHDDVHLNYQLHSSFSALDRNTLERMHDDAMELVRKEIMSCDVLLVTYGTAWVYERKHEGDIVNNCHKQSSALFNKRLLSTHEIENDFGALHTALKKVRPDIRIILTLSPVRHIKDTLELNNLSKSVLRVATHQISQHFNDVEYFPAFELMIDDLRDYRFYKNDMLHPTEIAETYIYKKFITCYTSDDTQTFLKQWSELRAGLLHKSFHPSSKGHQQFLKTLHKKISALKKTISVDEELKALEKQIIS